MSPTPYDNQIQPGLDQFVANKGRQPSTPSDWSTIYRYAYPDETQMPAEFKTVVNQAKQLANTPIASRQSELDVLGMQQGAAGADWQSAKQTAQTASLTPGRFNILQEALRAKQGPQALGTSSIFEKAGLTGYGALAASLQSRAKEMEINYENYSNTIQSVFGSVIDKDKQLIDKANLALDNYKRISDRYKEVSDQIFTLERDEQDYNRQLELLAQQHKNDIELKYLDEKLSGSGGGLITTQTDAELDQYLIPVLSEDGKSVTGYEINLDKVNSLFTSKEISNLRPKLEQRIISKAAEDQKKYEASLNKQTTNQSLLPKTYEDKVKIGRELGEAAPYIVPTLGEMAQKAVFSPLKKVEQLGKEASPYIKGIVESLFGK